MDERLLSLWRMCYGVIITVMKSCFCPKAASSFHRRGETGRGQDDGMSYEDRSISSLPVFSLSWKAYSSAPDNLRMSSCSPGKDTLQGALLHSPEALYTGDRVRQPFSAGRDGRGNRFLSSPESSCTLLPFSDACVVQMMSLAWYPKPRFH